MLVLVPNSEPISAKGEVIAGVLKSGPADLAGVKPGDVLIAVNGKPVSDSSSLLNLIAVLKPGESARLSVARKSSNMEFDVKVARRPPQLAQQPGEGGD